MTVYRLVVCILLIHGTSSRRGALSIISPRAQLVGVQNLGGQTRSKVFWPRFKSPLARLYEAVNQTFDPLERFVFISLDVTIILVLVLVDQRRGNSRERRRRENEPRFPQFPAQVTDLFRLPILGRLQRRVDRQKRPVRDFQVRNLKELNSL